MYFNSFTITWIFCFIVVIKLPSRKAQTQTNSSLLQSRAKLGENCNDTVFCDSNAFLYCRNSLCECQKQDSMYYDPIIKSCFVRVREKCRYQLRNEEIGVQGVEELECVQNAWCNQAGVCMCAGTDYVELSNGTCTEHKMQGERCSTDFECRRDQFLECIEGFCDCNGTVSVYNTLRRICVGKAGFPCLGDGCVYNADCTNPGAVSDFSKDPSGLKTCGCNPGYFPDAIGNCKVDLGGNCSQTNRCAHGICKDGECVCEYENVQLRNTQTNTCISLVGGPCNETIVNGSMADELYNLNITRETFQCVENACCEFSGGIYSCKCNKGFVENLEGTCDLAFGEICTTPKLNEVSPSDSNPVSLEWNYGLRCDRITPLFCVNGKCDCESSLYEYDFSIAVCMGKVGARCLRSQLNDTSSCIAGANCLSNRGLSSQYGTCICSNGFTTTSNRTCLKAEPLR